MNKSFLASCAIVTILTGCTVLKIEEAKRHLWHFFYIPSLSFSKEIKPQETDYSNKDFWASHPSKIDEADFTPNDIKPTSQEYDVDVFFIHPTSFIGSSWIYPINFNTPTHQNTLWYLRNQASVFNQCCNIYAPHYRQVSIHTYIKNLDKPSDADVVLDFAYQDIKSAFSYFIKHFSRGKPFVIASHSQGSHHAHKLLAEIVDKSPDLSNRLVVAYTLGSVNFREWSKEYFHGLTNIEPCANAKQTRCIIHWDTKAAGTDPIHRSETSLCINPLTWAIDGGITESNSHLGSLVPEGNFHHPTENDPSFILRRPAYVTSLGQLKRNFLTVECKNGTLFVSPIGLEFDTSSQSSYSRRIGDYHLLDYSLFYLDIQENVSKRITAFKSY